MLFIKFTPELFWNYNAVIGEKGRKKEHLRNFKKHAKGSNIHLITPGQTTISLIL